MALGWATSRLSRAVGAGRDQHLLALSAAVNATPIVRPRIVLIFRSGIENSDESFEFTIT